MLFSTRQCSVIINFYLRFKLWEIECRYCKKFKLLNSAGNSEPRNDYINLRTINCFHMNFFFFFCVFVYGVVFLYVWVSYMYIYIQQTHAYKKTHPHTHAHTRLNSQNIYTDIQKTKLSYKPKKIHSNTVRNAHTDRHTHARTKTYRHKKNNKYCLST